MDSNRRIQIIIDGSHDSCSGPAGRQSAHVNTFLIDRISPTSLLVNPSVIRPC